MEPAKEKLSAAQLAAFVKDKRDLYELAIRNGYYLPKYTSGAITEDYLVGVLQGRCWCPKYSEIRLMPCVRPPAVDVLLEKFREGTLLHGKFNVYIDTEHRPDVKWLVDVVATLMPYDEIFAKDYVAPPRKQPMRELKNIELDPSLLDDMPLSRSKAKARRLRIVGTAVTESRIQRLKHIADDVVRAIAKEEMANKIIIDKKNKRIGRVQKPFTNEELKQSEDRKKTLSLKPKSYLKRNEGTLASEVGGRRSSVAGQAP